MYPILYKVHFLLYYTIYIINIYIYTYYTYWNYFTYNFNITQHIKSYTTTHTETYIGYIFGKI